MFLSYLINHGWQEGFPSTEGEYLIVEARVYEDEVYYRYDVATFNAEDKVFLDEYGTALAVYAWKKIIAPRFERKQCQ